MSHIILVQSDSPLPHNLKLTDINEKIEGCFDVVDALSFQSEGTLLIVIEANETRINFDDEIRVQLRILGLELGSYVLLR